MSRAGTLSDDGPENALEPTKLAPSCQSSSPWFSSGSSCVTFCRAGTLKSRLVWIGGVDTVASNVKTRRSGARCVPGWPRTSSLPGYTPAFCG